MLEESGFETVERAYELIAQGRQRVGCVAKVGAKAYERIDQVFMIAMLGGHPIEGSGDAVCTKAGRNRFILVAGVHGKGAPEVAANAICRFCDLVEGRFLRGDLARKNEDVSDLDVTVEEA